MSEPEDESVDGKAKITPNVHRRVLTFLNSATWPADLMHVRTPVRGHRHRDGDGDGHAHATDAEHEVEIPERHREIVDRDVAIPMVSGAEHQVEIPERYRQIFDQDVATRIFSNREASGAYGFRDISELVNIEGLRHVEIDSLWRRFGPRFYGEWKTLPYPTQQPDGTPVDVGHAAMLSSGKVLFIPADYENQGWPTPIWNPNDEARAVFEYPAVNPDYALFCSGHSFLSDGKLLAVGGGGDNGVTPGAVWGFKFDPVTQRWIRTSGPGREYRWYPTALTLGDGRVIVTCGNGLGHMEAYNPRTDRFDEIGGDTRLFPNLYPGLHLLPNHRIFYSRTGWSSAYGGPPRANDNQSAYFTFSGGSSGSWTNIVPASANRAKGMSVTILQPSYPYARVIVIGGVDDFGTGLDSAEIIDVSMPSPASRWTPLAGPDSEIRRQCNAVLLPDGTVFVSGGIDRVYSPCTIFDPSDEAWYPMDELPSIRGYHSVSLLLPSGKVLAAGGDGNPRIEVFSPPYLFRGARPTITAAPPTILYGTRFSIETPAPAAIYRAVLVRPMAVTHQTDTEQRVIALQIRLDPGRPTSLWLDAPSFGSRSMAPGGYYMLFILDANDIPSEAKWVFLSPSMPHSGHPVRTMS